MDKELFAEILGSLEQRRDLCQKFLGGIYTTTDLSQISLARAAELKRFCVEEETIMTKICMVDLYHIIGMGNLSPNQMMKFTYTMQDYLSYRPAVKVLAQKLDRIEDLPRIPVKTRFRLLGLGNVTLTYGEGEVVDEASIEDYENLKTQNIPEPPAELPFTIEGSRINVDFTKLELFVQLMSEVFKSPLSVDNLRNKINNRGEYLGINWIGMTYEADTNSMWAIGNMSSNNTRQKIIGYFTKKS